MLQTLGHANQSEEDILLNSSLTQAAQVAGDVNSIRSQTISSTVSAIVRAPRREVFNWFIPVKLQDILLGYGPLPAVVGTSGQTGPWDQPGSSRTVHLADGNTAQEQVTAYEYPRYFAYRVSGFTNVLRFFTHEALCQWWFEDAGDSTRITWTYTFNAKSPLRKLLLAPIVKLLLNGYMRVGMRAVKAQAEKSASID